MNHECHSCKTDGNLSLVTYRNNEMKLFCGVCLKEERKENGENFERVESTQRLYKDPFSVKNHDLVDAGGNFIYCPICQKKVGEIFIEGFFGHVFHWECHMNMPEERP